MMSRPGLATAGMRDVVLRDGRTLRLRPPRSDDRDALLAFLEDLDMDSLYMRFHGLPAIRPALVEPELDPDWVERGSLVATMAANDGECIVALGSYARLRDPDTAEVAFAVAVDLRG